MTVTEWDDEPRDLNFEGLSVYGDFSGKNMSGALFSGCSVRALFRNADLRGADFSRADASVSDFTGADLSGAILERGDFYSAKFRETNLTDAWVLDAKLPPFRLGDAYWDMDGVRHSILDILQVRTGNACVACIVTNRGLLVQMPEHGTLTERQFHEKFGCGFGDHLLGWIRTAFCNDAANSPDAGLHDGPDSSGPSP